MDPSHFVVYVDYTLEHTPTIVEFFASLELAVESAKRCRQEAEVYAIPATCGRAEPEPLWGTVGRPTVAPAPAAVPAPAPAAVPAPAAAPAPAPAATLPPMIGIRGKKGAGKDTLAAEICACFPAFETRKWATKLREAVAIITDIPAECTVSDADKEVQLGGRVYGALDLYTRFLMAAMHVLGGREITADIPARMFTILTGKSPRVETVVLPMTVGRLLQLLGTECFRDVAGPFVWVDALMEPWVDAGRPPTLVADTRFPNESAAVRDAGGVIILVRRAAAVRADGRADEHASECALDDERADFVFDNDGSVADLRAAFLDAWPAILALAAQRRPAGRIA